MTLEVMRGRAHKVDNSTTEADNPDTGDMMELDTSPSSTEPTTMS